MHVGSDRPLFTKILYGDPVLEGAGRNGEVTALKRALVVDDLPEGVRTPSLLDLVHVSIAGYDFLECVVVCPEILLITGAEDDRREDSLTIDIGN